MLILLFYSTSCIDDIEEFEDESTDVLRLRCEFVSVNKATGRCPAKLPNDSGAVLRNINGALCDGKVASCIAVPVVRDGKISEIAVVSSTTGFNSEISPIVQIRGGGGDGAKASAVVKNGKVSQIRVTSTGSGYTQTPTVKVKNSKSTTFCKMCCG